MPAISIIVPVYKVEPYLRRCVDSILAQTFVDFELILVDDGSPDNCGTICDEYAEKDQRVRVIHKENGGVSSARNAGIATAMSDYICFIDSDDAVNKEYLEHLYFPQYDLVIIGIEAFSDENVKLWEKKFSQEIMHSPNINYVKLYKQLAAYSPCCKLFKSDYIKNNGMTFPSHITWGEDGMFIADYLVHVHSIFMSDNTGYCYYKHADDASLSTVVREDIVEMISTSREYCLRRIASIAPEQYEGVKAIITKDIINNCSYFVCKVLENHQLSLDEKERLIDRFLKNQYVLAGLSDSRRYYSGKMEFSRLKPTKNAKLFVAEYARQRKKALICRKIRMSLYDPLPEKLKRTLKNIKNRVSS